MILMVCLGFADGFPCTAIGQYLSGYDPDFRGGLGRATWTPHADAALKFATTTALYEFWRQTSRLKPIRADGRPNRPLTAYSVTTAEVDKLDDPSLLTMVRAARGRG